jgi:NAD(P)-dependent dehydrogenase (short-subunit alcohol dehydrogenase family)
MQLKKFNLNNKRVLVLGGMGLIGYEVARLCLENGSSVTVVDQKICKLKSHFLKKKFKNKVNFIKVSIDNKFLKSCKKYFYNHNSLVNCLYLDNKKINEIDMEKINIKALTKSISINVKFNIAISLKFSIFLKKLKTEGSLINFGSIYSLVAQDVNLYKNTNIKENIAYSFFKAGLVNFNKQLSTSFSRHGIRSNIVCPGGVKDPNNKLQNKKFIKNYSKRVPIGRMATAQEIGAVVMFLVSDSASYVTGSTIVVDGGWTSI